MHLLNTSQDMSVRQFACVLLSKKFMHHYEKSLNQKDRNSIKQALLVIYFKEPVRKIYNTIGYHMISAIYAQLCMQELKKNPKSNNANTYKEIFDAIEAKTSGNGSTIEDMGKSIVLLGILLEDCGTFMLS
jgi:hypothetical protein